MANLTTKKPKKLKIIIPKGGIVAQYGPPLGYGLLKPQ